MQSLEAFAQDKLAALDAEGLRRTLVPTRRLDGQWVERGGKQLLSFSCNDYLGFTRHPAVIEAAAKAVRDYGTGAAASRLVTGDHPLVGELEERLAAFKGAEAACVFSSGYAANLGAIPTFVGEDDLVLIDERAHACIWAGAGLGENERTPFLHNDTKDLESYLKTAGHNRRTLIITEGVFSMDGDIAPLGEISRLAREYGAWLMVDDAHGLGVVGEGGRGTATLFPTARVDLAMGTLSKALASAGGYVCGPRAAIDLLKTRARSFVYSTGLPPASAAAALAALEILESEPERAARPLALARRFAAAAQLPAPDSPIVPVVLGDPARALEAQRELEQEGFLVVAIRPPTVAKGTSRLRIAFTATLPEDEVDRLTAAVRRFL